MINTISWALRGFTRWFRWYTSAGFASGTGGGGYLWNYILQQPNTTPLFSLFQFTILTIQILFIEHIRFRVMCRERAWLFESGIAFVQRKGMTFMFRHGLCIEKGHGLWGQALSLYRERAWLIDSGIVLLHHSVFHSYLFYSLSGFPSIMSVDQALSVPMSKVYIFQINKPEILISIFWFLLSFVIMDYLVQGLTPTAFLVKTDHKIMCDYFCTQLNILFRVLLA